MKARAKPPPAMRVAMVFGGSVIAERTLDSPRDVYLGDAPGAALPLPHGAIDAESLTLLEPTVDGGWALRLHPRMGGALWRDGQRVAVSQLDANRIVLGDADYGVITLGGVAFFFQRVGAAPAIGRRWLALDPSAYASLGLSTFLHLAALLLLFLAQREAPTPMIGELPADLLRQFLVTPPVELTPPAEPIASADDGFQEAPGSVEGELTPEPGQRARTSRRPSTETRTSRAPRGSLLEAIVGPDGNGNALAAATEGLNIAGIIDGARVGSTGGGDGFGLRGNGDGPRSGGGDRFGAGDGNTRVGGDGPRRGPRRGPRQRVERRVRIPRGDPIVDGTYPPERIQRVVMRNRMQIRYCYENELQRIPTLRGTVRMSWRIGGDGRATSVRVAQSTLRNARVEGCIVRQVRRWRFPPPDNGQRVGVNYPFMLGVGG